MESIDEYLASGAVGDLVPWGVQRSAMERFACSCAEVEERILSLSLLPARYQRNRQTISTDGQLRLFRSRVAVIGCGGLGGYVIEQLARLGVGNLVAVDPDVFEEHNLNRQLLSTIAELGKSKVAAAVDRIASINPAVTVTPHQDAFTGSNGAGLLEGVELVMDALDNIPSRLELSETCSSLGIPLIHGAIGGWYGHLTTQFPGEEGVKSIYRNWSSGKGVEQQLGNPSFTPAVVASMQVAEACKLLLGEERHLRGRILSLDLHAMEFHEMSL